MDDDRAGHRVSAPPPLAAVFDDSPDPTAALRPVFGPDGALVDVVYANARAAQRFPGRPTVAELVGPRLFERFPAARGRLHALYARAAAARGPTRERIEAPQQPGRWTELSVLPFEGGFLHIGRDVSDEVAASERLRTSEERFRRTMHSAPIGMCLVAPDGRFLDVNPALCAMLGRDAASLVACTWQELTHADDVGVDLGLVGDVLAGRIEGYRLTKRYLRPDGSVVWGDLAVACVRDAAGAVEHFVSQIVDVSAAVAAREALEQSEARFRQTLDSLLEGAMILGHDYRYLYLNEAIARQGFVTREECMGRTMLEVYPGVERSELFGAYRRCVAERTPQRASASFTFPGGETRWFEISVHPVPEGIFILSIDRTEAHLAAEAREHAASRDRLLFTESGDGLCLVGPDGRILDANPAFCAMLAEPHERLVGRRLTELFAASDAHPLRTPPVGETMTVERRVVRSDGREIVVAARLRVLPDGTVIGSARDLTRERALDAEIAESRRLEAVGRLAGGVAHNFNNALAAINGTAELLAATCPAGDPRHEDIDAILQAGRSAADLARQLLAVGRRQALRPAPFDLREALVGLAPTLRQTLGEARELALDLGATSAFVVADRGRVEEIVLDLTINARDAMPEGGKLTLALAHVEATPGVASAHPHVRPGPHVRLEVRDSGAGIAPDVLPHLFEPFFTTKAFGQGRGLGLSTVAGTVDQSGGWVEVASELGRGATFAVHLPAIAERASSSVVPVAPAVGSEVILLVEDEHLVRKVTARALRDLGYQVLEADDPATALALEDAVLARVDLLLTDVVMPEVDGPRLARSLAARRPGLATLFISGYAYDTLVRDRLVDPGARLLSKPFTRVELSEAVRRALARPAG